MEFKFQNWRERKQQHFDKDKIMLKKAGQEFNVYDSIQEAREDTELEVTLYKYGCLDRIQMNYNKTFDDFTKFKDLRGSLEQMHAAKEMFYNLPIDVRQKFNNDINQFTKNGEKWLKSEMNKEAKNANTKVDINNNTNIGGGTDAGNPTVVDNTK